MRIAILGASGQLGTAIQKVLEEFENLELLALGRDQVNLAKLPDIIPVLTELNPDCVINCAAYNLVDKGEDEAGMAYVVNALGPRRVAKYCADQDIPMVHVSSDYVFGADQERTTPYSEDETPGPLSCYGVSKLSGEYYVRNECPKHFILRTCGLYGLSSSAGKGNFVETMFLLSTEREELSIVNDQFCTPTSAEDLAVAISKLIQTDQYGLYHATNSGSTTWYEFAKEIFNHSGTNIKLTPVTSDQYPTLAARPKYSLLDCSKLTEVIGEPLPDWKQALSRYLDSRPEIPGPEDLGDFFGAPEETPSSDSPPPTNGEPH